MIVFGVSSGIPVASSWPVAVPIEPSSCGERKVSVLKGFVLKFCNLKLFLPQGNRWLCLSTLSDAHERTIRSIAWSHDGRFLASSSFDGSTCIWHKTSSRANEPSELNSNNVANETEWSVLVSLEGHENEVKCCAWSANDKYLATCSRDKTVWVWEVIGETNTQKEAERKELADSLRTTSDEDSMKNQKRDHHEEPSPAAAPDDDDAGQEPYFECASVQAEHSQDVKHVAWHPRLNVLASSSFDNTIILYCQVSCSRGNVLEFSI